MQQILQTLNALKAQLDALRPLPPDAAARLRQHLDFQNTYHSNAIEGNSLDWNETKTFLLHGLTAKGKPLKDHLDLQGHREALNLLEEMVKEPDVLTHTNLKHLHLVLLKEPYEITIEDALGNRVSKRIKVGEYKTEPNHVRTTTGEMFHFTEPGFVVAEMTDLFDWYRDEEQKCWNLAADALHPVVLAVGLHYRFVRIHPFDDGNGRMARLLMNFCLMRFGFPPAIISIDDRSAYYRAFQAADATGELRELTELVAQAVEQSLELSLQAARGESIDERDDWKKKLKLLEMDYAGINQPEINHMMDRELMMQRMEDSFIPLFQAFHDTTAPFRTFFNEYKDWIAIDNLGSYPTEAFTLELYIDECAKHGNFPYNEGRLGYAAKFSELSKLPDINLFLTMDIRIQKYHYVISSIHLSGAVTLNRPLELKRLHIQTIQIDETKDWASKLGMMLTDALGQILRPMQPQQP